MPGIGVWELVIILIIVVIIFGAGRLSDVGGALGKGVREFRKATTDEHIPPPTAASVPVVPVPVVPVPAAQGTAPSEVPAVVIENRCPSCATVNPTGQVFCGQCGTRLTSAALP